MGKIPLMIIILYIIYYKKNNFFSYYNSLDLQKQFLDIECIILLRK